MRSPMPFKGRLLDHTVAEVTMNMRHLAVVINVRHLSNGHLICLDVVRTIYANKLVKINRTFTCSLL